MILEIIVVILYFITGFISALSTVSWIDMYAESVLPKFSKIIDDYPIIISPILVANILFWPILVLSLILYLIGLKIYWLIKDKK